MPTLRNDIHIDASPDAVWAVLGDLRSTPGWIPGVVEATVEDDRRVCRTADGHEIRERIVDYSETDRRWSYEQSHVPLPITESRGTLAVHEDNDGARVAWEASFELMDPSAEELVPMIDGYYKQTLDSLGDRVRSSAARPPSE